MRKGIRKNLGNVIERRNTNRVNVGETHDGAVCGTAEDGRKHKVGESTQSQESMGWRSTSNLV